MDEPMYFGCHCELLTGELSIAEGCKTTIWLRLRLAELEKDVALKATLKWEPEREEYRREHPEYLGRWEYRQ